MKKGFPVLSVLLLVIAVLGQRFAFNIIGMQIGVSFIAFYLFIIYGILSQQVVIRKKRFLLYLVSLTGLLIAVLITSYRSSYVSAFSFFLLIVLYFLSVFAFKENLEQIILTGFQRIILLIAIIGILQFITQLIGIPYRDWLSFIPDQNILGNYNYSIPIEYGSKLYKANGIFLQEPSTFSQLMALGILLELYLFKKYARLVVWLAALLVSFSGTGLVLVGVGLMPMIFRFEIKKLIVFSYIGVITIAIFIYTGFAIYTFNRVTEFENSGKSAYIRFIAPYVAYVNFLEERNNLVDQIFGLGPGASERHNWETLAHFNPPTKLVVEYGLFGILFFLYLIYIFFSHQPFWLAFSLFIMYTLLSGGLLTYQTTIFIYLLLTLHQNNRVDCQNFV